MVSFTPAIYSAQIDAPDQHSPDAISSLKTEIICSSQSKLRDIRNREIRLV